jgi:hypothetical protein
MADFYKFASESPWLTFFLFLIVGETIARAAIGLGQFRFVEKKESKRD